MIKTTISLLIGASLALLGPQVVHARGCGGARASGGYHGGSYSGSRSDSGESGGGYGGASEFVQSILRRFARRLGRCQRHARRGVRPERRRGRKHPRRVRHRPKGQSYNSQEERGAAAGPNGAVAGGSRSTSATGAEGQSYSGQREGAAAAGPNGAAAAGGYHGTAGYGTAHTALPTDAGFGMPGRENRLDRLRRLSPDRGGQRQRLRRPRGRRQNLVQRLRHVRGRLACRQSRRLGGGGLDGRSGLGPGHLARRRRIAGLGAGVQPVAYNYGTNVTYQDNQVYYGNQPVATADQYYQQAATLAQSAPAADAAADEWMPLGVFALVQKEQSDPHYVMQLAVNKVGGDRAETTPT